MSKKLFLGKPMYKNKGNTIVMGGLTGWNLAGLFFLTTISVFIYRGESELGVQIPKIFWLEIIKVIVGLIIFFTYQLHKRYKVPELEKEPIIEVTKNLNILVSLFWGLVFNKFILSVAIVLFFIFLPWLRQQYI